MNTCKNRTIPNEECIRKNKKSVECNILHLLDSNFNFLSQLVIVCVSFISNS